MEVFVDTFVDAPVEYTFTEAFVSFISSIESSMLVAVDVLSMKASITSTEASVTSTTASEENFVEFNCTEAFEYCMFSWKLPRKLP